MPSGVHGLQGQKDPGALRPLESRDRGAHCQWAELLFCRKLTPPKAFRELSCSAICGVSPQEPASMPSGRKATGSSILTWDAQLSSGWTLPDKSWRLQLVSGGRWALRLSVKEAARRADVTPLSSQRPSRCVHGHGHGIPWPCPTLRKAMPGGAPTLGQYYLGRDQPLQDQAAQLAREPARPRPLSKHRSSCLPAAQA